MMATNFLVIASICLFEPHYHHPHLSPSICHGHICVIDQFFQPSSYDTSDCFSFLLFFLFDDYHDELDPYST